MLLALLKSPLALGSDIVVHSVTKYIGGHSDVVMGVVCTNDENIYTKIRFIQNGVGAVPSPFDCFLAHRGLKTLHVRMEAAARYVRLYSCVAYECTSYWFPRPFTIYQTSDIDAIFLVNQATPTQSPCFWRVMKP